MAGDSFQLGRATVLELQIGAGNEVFDGRGGQYLAGACLRCNPGADIDGNAGDLLADQFALANVQAGADLEPELLTDRASDRVGAADCPDRAVEGRKEAVTCRVDLASAEAAELLTNECMMALYEFAPACVA